MHSFALLKTNRKQNQKHLNVLSILTPQSKRQLKSKSQECLSITSYVSCFHLKSTQILQKEFKTELCPYKLNFAVILSALLYVFLSHNLQSQGKSTLNTVLSKT